MNNPSHPPTPPHTHTHLPPPHTHPSPQFVTRVLALIGATGESALASRHGGVVKLLSDVVGEMLLPYLSGTTGCAHIYVSSHIWVYVFTYMYSSCVCAVYVYSVRARCSCPYLSGT